MIEIKSIALENFAKQESVFGQSSNNAVNIRYSRDDSFSILSRIYSLKLDGKSCVGPLCSKRRIRIPSYLRLIDGYAISSFEFKLFLDGLLLTYWKIKPFQPDIWSVHSTVSLKW